MRFPSGENSKSEMPVGCFVSCSSFASRPATRSAVASAYTCSAPGRPLRKTSRVPSGVKSNVETPVGESLTLRGSELSGLIT